MLQNPSHPALNIIPRPASLTLVPGECSVLSTTVIQSHSALTQEAVFLATRLRRATGWEVPITGADSSPWTANASSSAPVPTDHEQSRTGDRFVIKMTLADVDGEGGALGEEDYELTTSSFRVEITARTAAGVFHGIQTLLLLFPSAIFSHCARIDVAWTLPKVTVRDRPRFGWRGAMLDCARHFFSVSDVKSFIDLLALHKLNVFHWHLTDDQGWRVEIKKHPRLTGIGAWRKETMRGHSSARLGGDGIPHGGFYTQDEVREIVAYATARHITIVPEIDMPGHSRAAIAAYPQLGSSDTPVDVWTEWGVTDAILNPAPETIRFCEDVLTEIMALFPGKFIHIGGDEAVKTQWIANPEIGKFMGEVGAKTPEELQRWFILRINEFLVRNGRRLVGWDEILEGGPVSGATIMGWRGWLNAGVKAAQSGHDVVMTPSAFTYFNHYQSEDIENEPISIGGRFISLEMAYTYEPVAAELTDAQAAHIVGIQASLWTEYIGNRALLEYMAFPRLCALAETGWTPRALRDHAVFEKTLRKHLRRLSILGVNHRRLD